MIGKMCQIAALAAGFAAVIATSQYPNVAAGQTRQGNLLEDVSAPCETVKAVSSEPIAAGYTKVSTMEVPKEETVTAELPADQAEQMAAEQSYSPDLVYLGAWTTTAYCACSICCGEWANGYTASGTLATGNHTVACTSLPFGTQVMIDGVIYTVEDTGVTGEWIDIYFDTHEEALNYGMHTKDIYLVEG